MQQSPFRPGAGADADADVGAINSQIVDSDIRAKLPVHKFTACSRCHSKKIKCSGGRPCQSCRQNGAGDGCCYPDRNRTVKVTQRFLDSLCEEIALLRQQQRREPASYNEHDHHRSENDSTHGRRRVQGPLAQTEPSQPQPPQQPQRPREATEGLQEASTKRSNSRTGISHVPEPASASGSHLMNGNQAGSGETVAEGEGTGAASLSYTRGQGSWFDSRNIFQTPVLIGETADAAFVTRFRQSIADPQGPEPRHLLCLNFFTDEALEGLAQAPVTWPSPSHARFLIEAALRYLARSHYLVQREVVTGAQGTEMLTHPDWGPPEVRAKFWVLFALGELASSRSLPDDSYPGVSYFAQANKLLGQLNERPGLDYIEALLMISLYSLALNRRYSAYVHAGTAMRSAVVMGLHLCVPRDQLPDPFVRERRKRVFWTAYCFDRRWGALLNLPPAIQDSVIEDNYPSETTEEPLNPIGRDPGTCSSRGSTSTSNSDYHVASIQLHSLLSGVLDSVYGLKHRNDNTRLLARVNRALEGLQEWFGRLPPSLHIDKSEQGPHSTEAVSLVLLFYQCVILATRPMLLYSLRLRAIRRFQTGQTSRADAAAADTAVPASAVALSEACVRCARHSAHILTQSWIEGSFATFDHFFPRYLLASATILAISSLLGSKESLSDRETFEQAARLIRKLQEAGNCTAQGYCDHVQAMEVAMAEYQGNIEHTNTPGAASVLGDRNAPGAAQYQTHNMQHMGGQTLDPLAAVAGMPWTEPSLQQLLSQPALDVQFLEAAVNNGLSRGLYWSDNR